jgi:hypothetical protein
LLRHGTPILAVVYAPTSPDHGPDLISWPERGPITRNGAIVTIDLSQRDLAAGDVVFLNHGAWQRPVWHGNACAPAGFMPLPSIAYRLARIAVGDGIATLTLRPVNALDIAAGHALLMAAGGVLVAEDGVPVTYNELGESRPSACFGGTSKAVDTLRARTWRGSQEPRREPRITLNWPRTVPEAMLDRAAGCLFGLAIGGNLGPETELGLIVARSLVGQSEYDTATTRNAVAAWMQTARPRSQTSPSMQSGDTRTSALVRAIGIGIWARDSDIAAATAGLDCPEAPAGAAVAAAIAEGMRGGSPAAMRRWLGNAGLTLPEPDATAWTSAVSGALAGAAYGRGVFPVPQIMRILTWRPDAGLGVAQPRPEICWTDDLVDLAEALLRQRSI